MADIENKSAEEEHTFHHYEGNDIPWYVRVLWIMFWVYAVYYVVRYLLPAVQIEMLTPP